MDLDVGEILDGLRCAIETNVSNDDMQTLRNASVKSAQLRRPVDLSCYIYLNRFILFVGHKLMRFMRSMYGECFVTFEKIIWH